MEKTAMPIDAGILNIVSGVLGLLGFVAFLIASIAVGLGAVSVYIWVPGIGVALSVLIVLTVSALAVGVLAVIGGIYALQRKQWGLALTGSICALFVTFVLGLVAVILISLSKNEFE